MDCLYMVSVHSLLYPWSWRRYNTSSAWLMKYSACNAFSFSTLSRNFFTCFEFSQNCNFCKTKKSSRKFLQEQHCESFTITMKSQKTFKTIIHDALWLLQGEGKSCVYAKYNEHRRTQCHNFTATLITNLD